MTADKVYRKRLGDTQERLIISPILSLMNCLCIGVISMGIAHCFPAGCSSLNSVRVILQCRLLHISSGLMRAGRSSKLARLLAIGFCSHRGMRAHAFVQHQLAKKPPIRCVLLYKQSFVSISIKDYRRIFFSCVCASVVVSIAAALGRAFRVDAKEMREAFFPSIPLSLSLFRFRSPARDRCAVFETSARDA